MEEKDTMKQLCIQQGYIPATCTLHGMLVWGLINKGEDPCSGCNADRCICKGRDKKITIDDAEALKKLEQQRQYENKKEEEKQLRIQEHLTTIKLYRLLEIDFDYRLGYSIDIKDLIYERAYSIRNIKSIQDLIDNVIYCIHRFNIQQIHMETHGCTYDIYDNLKRYIKKNEIKCDIVSFKYTCLNENTKLYSNDLIKNKKSNLTYDDIVWLDGLDK